MFDCLLCNDCANWCETGYEPAKFIREARRELVARDALPGTIEKAVNAALDHEGCIYGYKEISGDLKAEAEHLPVQAEVLLVLGDAVVMRRPEIGIAAIRLLKRAGVDFTVLKNEPCIGNDLYDLIGDLEETYHVAERFADAVRETGCKTMVVLDPFAARILLEDYRRWSCKLPAVRTATAFMAELLESERLRIGKHLTGTVTYHDPERLARDLKETEPARIIIRAMAAPWKEIFLHNANTRSCGNDVVRAYSPKIIEMTGRLRMDDALRTGATLLITASPSDKDILSAVKEPMMRVEDIFVLLDDCTAEEAST